MFKHGIWLKEKGPESGVYLMVTEMLKDGVEISAKELDLVGKLSKIVCGLADAVFFAFSPVTSTLPLTKATLLFLAP